MPSNRGALGACAPRAHHRAPPETPAEHLPPNPPTRPQTVFSLPFAHSLDLQRVWAHGLPRSQSRRGAGHGGGVSGFAGSSLCRTKPVLGSALAASASLNPSLSPRQRKSSSTGFLPPPPRLSKGPSAANGSPCPRSRRSTERHCSPCSRISVLLIFKIF